MAKKYKRLEKIFMIGLVILLLAVFSVTGAVTSCQSPAREGRSNGGTFKLRGEEADIDDLQFDADVGRVAQSAYALRRPILTNEFSHVVGNARTARGPAAGWSHQVQVAMAKQAGYRVGERELNDALRDTVGAVMRRGASGELSDAAYREFLREGLRGVTQEQFEETVREMLLRDAVLEPLVYTAAYDGTYADAYETWKNDHEQVDLEYLAVAADSFVEPVRKIQDTRKILSKQSFRIQRIGLAAQLVRRWRNRARGIKEDKGAWPADLEALAEGMPHLKDEKDAWGNAPHYTFTEGAAGPTILSDGPDGEAGTADDVSFQTVEWLDSYGALRRVGTALIAWRKDAKAWPADLPTLLNKPAEAAPPPLSKERDYQDGWSRELAFEATDDAATLTSLGPDGKVGTEDDLSFVIKADQEEARVPLTGPLAPLLGLGLKDVWERPLDIGMTSDRPWVWHVRSAGPDGELGSEDDIKSGNELEIKSFFRLPQIQNKVQIPSKRSFEAIYVHLPLLSNDVLKTLWAQFPQHRPASEEAVYEHWRDHQLAFYKSENPSDAETGHGAARMAKVAPGAPLNLVPDASVFTDLPKGDTLAAEEDAGKEDTGADAGEEDAGSEGSDDAARDDATRDDAAREDALRKTFKEKGWREIVARDMFIERLLADLLTRARASQVAVAAWDAKYKHTEAEDTEPEDGEERPVRPEPVTFATLIAGELAAIQPSDEQREAGVKTIEHFLTEEPLEDKAWREHKDLGGHELSLALGSMNAKGQYGSIPLQIGDRRTKAILRNIELFPAKQPPFEEVEDVVYEEFLKKCQLDEAVKRLTDLREAIQKAEDEDAETGYSKAIAAWREGAGASLPNDQIVEGTTGWILGGQRPVQEHVAEDASDAEKRRLGALNLALRMGYDAVRELRSEGSTSRGVSVGALGRRILRGEDERMAVLVRVKEQRFPPKGALSPEDYVQWLRTRAFGSRFGRGERPKRLRDVPGTVPKAYARWVDNYPWLEKTFDLAPRTPVEDDADR